MSLLLPTEEKLKLKKEITDYVDKHCLFRADPAVVYAESLKHEPGKLVGRSAYSTINHMFMMRRLTHNPDMFYKVIVHIFDDIVSSLPDKEFPQFQFCGLESGSLPLITGLQMYAKSFGLSINAFTVRKERKSYGLFHWVEGMPDNTPVMLIDDVVNSGSSMGRAYDVAAREYGLTSAKNSYTIIELGRYEPERFPWTLNSIVKSSDFSTEYTDAKYWLPADCDISKNKRPEYR